MRTRSTRFVVGRYIVFGFFGLAAFTALIFLLWNWLVPAVFSGPVITYWQALGILVLSKILFSGIWKHRSPHSDYYHRPWRSRFEEKMKNMSEEDRERFKAKFQHRHFHFGPHYNDDKTDSREEGE